MLMVLENGQDHRREGYSGANCRKRVCTHFETSVRIGAMFKEFCVE